MPWRVGKAFRERANDAGGGGAMNVLLEAAKEICVFMADREWDFCIIGGLAMQRCFLKAAPEKHSKNTGNAEK